MKRLLAVVVVVGVLGVVVFAPGVVEDTIGIDLPDVAEGGPEAEFVTAINEHRTERGLRALERNATLDEMAADHSRESKTRLLNSQTADDLANQFGYRCPTDAGLEMDHVVFEIEPGQLSDEELSDLILQRIQDKYGAGEALNGEGHRYVGVGVHQAEVHGTDYLYATVIVC